jgi:peptidyl-prolyl cis-trans isomerase C
MSLTRHASLFLTALSFSSFSVSPNEDPIVATVESRAIRISDLKAESLPDQLKGAFKTEKEAFVFLRELAVTQTVLLEAAHKSGIDKDPDVQKTIQTVLSKAIEDVSSQVILQAFIEKNVSAKTLLADAQKSYAEYLKSIPKNSKEVHLSHIVLTSEADAQGVIHDLKNGIDFMKLAREKSIDKETGPQGGAFPNYIREDELIPDFSKAVSALSAGKYTQTPVHSPLGWHILKVTDKRPFKAKRFEEVRKALQSQIMNDRLKSLTETLKLKASIELFDQNGHPDTSSLKSPRR